MMSLRLLVLGANGFIGSNLIERVLASRDWKVQGVDLQSHRLGAALEHPNFDFLGADVLLAQREIDRLIQRSDIVLPLVAIATPMRYIREPLRTFEVTFSANLRVIERCADFEKRVIFPSTSEVYGMSEDLPFDEETSRLVLGPVGKHRWIYSASKQLLDRVIHAYGLERGLRYTIFRPFNWIGPRLDDVMDPREGSSRVLTQFIGQIIRGEDLRLVDGGNQRRCFLYIDDALEALFEIIENRDGCADQRIFNLGNPANDISIRELAELLLRLVARHERFRDVAERVRCREVSAAEYYGNGFQDAPLRAPSIRAAETFLGWKPEVDIETAITRTLDYYLASAELQKMATRLAPRVRPSSSRRGDEREQLRRGQLPPSA